MAEPTPGPKPNPSEDWPSQAADQIVSVVGQIRDRTTGSVLTASRGVVYGLFAALVGLAAFVVLCIFVDRVFVEIFRGFLDAIDARKPGRANWMADIAMALLFGAGAALFWKKAHSAPAD